MATDYKDTLNLPETEFPMRGNLAEREPAMIEHWESIGIYEKMIEQMKRAGLDPTEDGFRYYLQAFKYGLPMHGGCGMGVDRVVQKTIGLANIKEATLFPRDINRLTP